jgi:hypothetical protein
MTRPKKNLPIEETKDTASGSKASSDYESDDSDTNNNKDTMNEGKDTANDSKDQSDDGVPADGAAGAPLPADNKSANDALDADAPVWSRTLMPPYPLRRRIRGEPLGTGSPWPRNPSSRSLLPLIRRK